MKLTDAFENSKIKARITAQDNKAMNRLKEAVEKKIKQSKEKIYEGLDDFYTLLRLLAAYASGEYRDVDTRTIIAVIAVLIYFLNPMDVIPDFVATFGFVDDLTLLAYVIKTFKTEIDKFIEWEMEGSDVADEL